jgi:2-polyprenyl-6-methoxyphenol hydroxylase-like FAD-dependent oxidoreductase
MPGSTHHQVVIVGGGTAGITVSAILKRRAVGINLAIYEQDIGLARIGQEVSWAFCQPVSGTEDRLGSKSVL